MYSKNNKLVAILGGREYLANLTLRRFMVPAVRQQLQKLGIDFIIATNNPKAALQYEQIKGVKVVKTDEALHNEFMARQREVKPNLGAETRETINQYAIKNEYQYALHLDDNITSLFYHYNGKNKRVKKYRPLAFLDVMLLLFELSETSNMGAIGLEMSAFAPSKSQVNITAGFPYSFFVHKVDPLFKFENSTEDDIIMSIYNGENNKPSGVIRNAILYGKTSKKTAKDGNRKMYNELLKENKRGEYATKMWPNIYSRKVSYNVKSSTIQKEPMLQHKHTLKKPVKWDKELKIGANSLQKIRETVELIAKRELM